MNYKIIEQKVECESKFSYDEVLNLIERAGRICYNSTAKQERIEKEKFISNLLKRGHESVIEHISLTFKITTDRAIANEIVRHRIASYSQNSTRYIKFTDKVPIIIPGDIKNASDEIKKIWEKGIEEATNTYKKLIENNIRPELARSVLPLSTATNMYMTMNLRELRHFLKLRLHKSAHPEIREIAFGIYKKMKIYYPVFVSDIEREEKCK